MPNQKHPIWRIINLAVVFMGVTAVLYVCATQFDETEWKAIGGIMTILGGYEGIKQWVLIPLAEKTKRNFNQKEV